jgi:hypothetical protein
MEWLPIAIAAVVYAKVILFLIFGLKYLSEKSSKQKIK